MKICQFWGKKLISLSQKYEERVRKFSFFGRNHLKAELYRYIYITIFGKYLLMDYINGFLDPQCIVSQGASNMKPWSGQSFSPLSSQNTSRAVKRDRNYKNYL